MLSLLYPSENLTCLDCRLMKCQNLRIKLLVFFLFFLSIWCVVVRALFDVCASVSSQACLFIPDGYATPHGTMQFGASGVVSASRL